MAEAATTLTRISVVRLGNSKLRRRGRGMEISEEIKRLVCKEIEESTEMLKKWQWEAFTTYLPRCESPIEQKLLVYLMLYGPGLMVVHPQVEIKNPDPSIPSFRVDLLVYLEIPNPPFPPNTPYYVPLFGVECNGRDYHESHDQIERDKQRDRKLTTAGFPILRFTGSEINSNARKCAEEVSECFQRRLCDILLSVCQGKLVEQGEPIIREW